MRHPHVDFLLKASPGMNSAPEDSVSFKDAEHFRFPFLFLVDDSFLESPRGVNGLEF